jgi:hypothetical protein
MRQLKFSRRRQQRITVADAAVVLKREKAMPLAVSKDVLDELLAIRADLETAMLKFVCDRHYGAAERMLVIVDRSLHNLIRDAAIVAQSHEEPKVEAMAVPLPGHRFGEQAEDLPRHRDTDELSVAAHVEGRRDSHDIGADQVGPAQAARHALG